MHASFLQYMQQSGVHLRGYRLPPLPPRRDPFATVDEKTRTMIIKDIFLHKYLFNNSSFSKPGHFDDLVLTDHDGLFDWMKQRLDALYYATKPKGISYWEYDACYDEIKDIFFLSPLMATTALKVFIDFHTRRMSAAHLGGESLPFFFTEKFPINKLQHLSLHIAAGTGSDDDDHPRFHTLIKAIPDLHLTFTGLISLKVEVIWPPKAANDTSFLREPPQHLISTRTNIQKLAVMLSLATKRFAHVVLKSGEQMVFRGDWHLDQHALSLLLAPGYAIPARMPAESSPVAIRWPLGSRNGPKVRWE
jgi:hypothetical protein